MTDTRNYLVVDLGAESGRTILGALDAKQLTLKETHRFSNGPVRLNDGLHWDVLRLWGEIKLGIASTVRSGIKIDSIGLDPWGVDFALLDRNHSLLSNPFHYRDARAVVCASFEVEEYQPIRTDDWDEAFSKLLKIMSF